MRLCQTTAIVVAVQGAFTLFKLQGGNINWPFVLTVITFYAVLSGGLWKNAVWAALLGAVATLPQTILVSTQAFTWSCFVGLTMGPGLKLPAEGSSLHPFYFGLHGIQVMAAHGGFMPGMPGTQNPNEPIPCFGVNIVAVYVLVLLIFYWRDR